MFRWRSKKAAPSLPFRRWAAEIVLLLTSFAAFALESNHRLTQLIHKSWQTEQGLPQNAVYCLAQDHDGFLWFGTETGLVRFDGVRFKVFTEASDPAVPHNFSSSLLVAKDGTLWVGTRTGGLWRYRQGRFEIPFPELAHAEVWALAETSDGTIWAATERGLFHLLESGPVQLNLTPVARSNEAVALASIPAGGLWIGVRGGQVLRFDGSALRLAIGSEPNGRGTGVKALAYNDKESELWIARDGAGLQRYRGNVLTRIDLLPGQEMEYLETLHLDSEGALWIGTRDEGLIRYWRGEISGFGLAEGLADGEVLSILKDHEGSLWIGTHFGGLNRLLDGKAASFGKHEGLPVDSVSCVLPAQAGSLWVGTSIGLFKYSNHAFTEMPLGTPGRIHPKDIRALEKTRDGQLWIGTAGDGLASLKTNGEVRLYSRKDGLPDDFITLLFERRNGELWIGTVKDGISIRDPKTGRFRNPPVPEFLRTHIRSMAEDPGGELWIGTQNGLVRFSGGTFQEVPIPEAPELSVRHLLCDADGTLWIGSRDNGLLRLRNGKVNRFDIAAGLQHNRIYQILPAGENLWLAGNLGIERASRAELARVANNPRLRLTTQLYTKSEGLRTSECGGDFSPSAAMDAAGALWFGTRGGLVVIDPRGISRQQLPPKVMITSVSADNQRVAAAAFTGLKPGTRRIQFDYTALSLRNPANVFFKYRMDRVDTDWVDAGRTREAVYYNLKPGSYSFRVLACNDEGTWNTQGAVLAFSVAPRLYQTLWFRALAGLAIVSSLAAAYRSRVRNFRGRNRELSDLVSQRTSALASEVRHRSEAEQRLRQLNEKLESRVRERTAELQAAYENLELELHERHQAEQALARSEARLRRIVDSGMVGIFFWHKDGGISDANTTFLSMVGYTRAELENGSLSWRTLTPPEQADRDSAALEEIQKTGVCLPFEKEYLRKDGTRVPVMIGGASLSSETEKGVCFVLDITARKASEQEIHRLNLLLEARVEERTTELERANQQLADEVQERKRVAVALAAFSNLGQKLHSARTEKEAAVIVAETARSLIPHDFCSIELYGNDGRLSSVLDSVEAPPFSDAASHCSISVSIRNGSRVVGILGLRSCRTDAFSFHDANTLQALGDYCGGALDRIHAEEARRETERRFSTFMTNAPALAWMKDSQLRYVFTNESFQRFTGLAPEQIEGKTDFELWPELVAGEMRQMDVETRRTQAKLESQTRLRRCDGEARTLLTLRFLFTTGAGEQFVAGMAIDITEQKRAEEALHRLPQSILEAQEAERRRVARELHDGVNQAIASIKFRIQTAEQQILRSDSKWQDTCSKTKEMLDAVLQQVRRLSRNLRPGELDDFGLVPAVRSACQEMELRTGTTIKFSHSGFAERLPPALELSLYRIVQEALMNIEKHSAASEVLIVLEENESEVLLEIADNGCGFQPDRNQGTAGGLGLLHMRERASLVGGLFSVNSAPGNGVQIVIRAPINRTVETHE